jgi:hypothetical protein
MLRINLERIMQYLEYDKEDLISLPLGEIIDLDKLSEVKERDAIYQENLAIKDEVNNGAGGIAADAVGNQPLLLDAPFQGAPVLFAKIIHRDYLLP